MFASGSTWYKGSTNRNAIKTINIVDSYTATGSETESWDASSVQDGSLMAYIQSDGTTLTIAGNGIGRIYANANASYMFSYSTTASAFKNLTAINGLSLLDTSNTTNMSYMFYYCSNLASLDLSNFDTSKVTNMQSMFRYCTVLPTLDLSSFNTLAITSSTYLRYFAQYMNGLTTLYLNENFGQSGYLPAAGSSYGLFYVSSTKPLTVVNANSVMQSYAWTTDRRTVTYADSITAPTFASSDSWYKGSTAKSSITTINIVNGYTPTGTEVESWDASASGDGSLMAYVQSDGTTLTIAGNGANKIYANADSSYMFGTKDSDDETTWFKNVTAINGLGLLDTSNVTDMRAMFFECLAVTSLDLTNFNTAKVTNMDSMFSCCIKLANLDVSSFSTSNVVSMYCMFGSCYKLKSLNLENFDTSNVTDMVYMFYYDQSLTSVKISGFDTSNVTNMSHMFENCYKLEKVDVSGFDTSKVTDMQYMFYNCRVLSRIDVSGFDTSKVTSMYCMFAYCYDVTKLNVSNFDTSKVTNFTATFKYCQSISSLDLSHWSTSSNTRTLRYFIQYCSSLNTVTLNASFLKSTGSLPETGSTYGMAYVSTTTPITVINASSAIQSYDWAADNRTVTFVTQ
jgi:surface protein